MILGGALTTHTLVLEVGFANAAYNVRTMFAARSGFVLVPPYNHRLDLDTDGAQVLFARHDGQKLHYEDISFVLNKLLLFKAISADKAQEIRDLAQEILPAFSTLLFPDSRRTQLEYAAFENWVRFTFYSPAYSEMAERVRADLQQFLPPPLLLANNTGQELTLRTKGGERLMLEEELLKKIGAVLVSYGLLLPELYARFALNLYQFGVMQGARIYLHDTLHALKDAADVGQNNPQGSLVADQALRLLRTLAENGDLGLLSEADLAFLAHVRLFRPAEYEAFAGVPDLAGFMQLLVQVSGPEILQLMDAHIHADRAAHYAAMEEEGTEIIEGSATRQLDREEEYRRLQKARQKKLEE